jgi:hypothetical protein
MARRSRRGADHRLGPLLRASLRRLDSLHSQTCRSGCTSSRPRSGARRCCGRSSGRCSRCLSAAGEEGAFPSYDAVQAIADIKFLAHMSDTVLDEYEEGAEEE